MIILEGTIGAGKSTLLHRLHQEIPECAVGFEPLDDWSLMIKGQSLLSLFYQEPQRWAYTMETMTLMSRVRDYVKHRAEYGDRVIVERSVFSGRYCFARNSFLSGYLTEYEWRLYQEWFDFLIAQHGMKPRGFIYVRVDPERAYERIQLRNREGEAIDRAYLEKIGALHDAFLKGSVRDADLASVPVLELDGNDEFEHNAPRMREHVERVRAFIKEIL